MPARRSPALIAIQALRDVLARWASEGEPADGKKAPMVYRDEVLPRLMDALESLAVSSCESMQHQTLAEILSALHIMFERLPLPLRRRAEEIILCILSGLGEHMLTAGLRRALTQTAEALHRDARHESAAAVEVALSRLGESVGRLGSRATRAGA